MSFSNCQHMIYYIFCSRFNLVLKIYCELAFSFQNIHISLICISGDNNDDDDRVMYNYGQKWLQKHHIIGRAVG